MQPLVEEISLPEGLDELARVASQDSALTVYLRSGTSDFDSRYSFLAVAPFMVLRGRGSRFRLIAGGKASPVDPWEASLELLTRFSIEDSTKLGLPMGGCFGYWGYHLKDLLEPGLRANRHNEGREPDCLLGFYSSLLAHDQRLNKTWIISTGLGADGSRSTIRARSEMAAWKERMRVRNTQRPASVRPEPRPPEIVPELSREEFIRRVLRAQEYIRSGDIYQVNLSYALRTAPCDGRELFEALNARSPAPFSAWLQAPDLEIASASPEQFLRMSDRLIRTRPIKGTRPRSVDASRDAQFASELLNSPKENAELVMITDLLRNDLGKVCQFGSVNVPEVARLERFSHVQHLVSTVQGRLRADLSHLQALKACFPGGSITGAPKFRAMQIIDELEQAPRGCYTGALGYIGFNGESQLSILIRTAVKWRGHLWFNVGAGIVADSDPEAEHDETLVKAEGFLEALRQGGRKRLQ